MVNLNFDKVKNTYVFKRVMFFSGNVCSRGIEKIAWDASGERLALSYKVGEKLYEGLIAIYDVRRTPLISASLV